MKEMIAVKSCIRQQGWDFKREAILFDRIGVTALNWQIKNLTIWPEVPPDNRKKAEELEWLMEQGVIFQTPFYEDWTEAAKEISRKALEFTTQALPLAAEIDEMKAARDRADPVSRNELTGKQNKIAHLEACVEDMHTRLSVAELRKHEGIDAIPLLADSESFTVPADRKASAIEVVLSALPQPAPSTPWKRIIEYRNDPVTGDRLTGLRTWVTEVARGGLTASEMEEQLEWKIQQYRDHMKLHEIKAATGLLKIIILTAAELAEDLVRLKLGSVARRLFSITDKNLDFMEAELNAPNREVAYVYHTRHEFGNSST